MERYKNLAGDSPIVAFAMMSDGLEVQFEDAIYTYDSETPGQQHVDRMKTLARAGRGLSTYISRHVKTRYAAKRFVS